ncbi:MAG: DUF86 domain-containing protein [Leptolyngbya sp. SIO1E4]|nr:DUF86 domain-containing protein [Leptolyngbya sp. SIO1E4]
MIQTWFTQNRQVIGKASRSLSSAIRDQHPELTWSKIIGMRNILTHNYFGIDLDVVCLAVEQELPSLKREIAAILQSL